MNSESADAELIDIVVDFQDQISGISAARQEVAKLMATATAADGKVTVTVNAKGWIIETRFAPDIDDLPYSAIASAVTSAAQRAVAEVKRKRSAIMAPLSSGRTVDPAQIISAMPNLNGRIALPPPITMEPPKTETGRDITSDGKSAASGGW